MQRPSPIVLPTLTRYPLDFRPASIHPLGEGLLAKNGPRERFFWSRGRRLQQADGPAAEGPVLGSASGLYRYEGGALWKVRLPATAAEAIAAVGAGDEAADAAAGADTIDLFGLKALPLALDLGERRSYLSTDHWQLLLLNMRRLDVLPQPLGGFGQFMSVITAIAQRTDAVYAAGCDFLYVKEFIHYRVLDAPWQKIGFKTNLGYACRLSAREPMEGDQRLIIVCERGLHFLQRFEAGWQCLSSVPVPDLNEVDIMGGFVYVRHESGTRVLDFSGQNAGEYQSLYIIPEQTADPDSRRLLLYDHQAGLFACATAMDLEKGINGYLWKLDLELALAAGHELRMRTIPGLCLLFMPDSLVCVGEGDA